MPHDPASGGGVDLASQAEGIEAAGPLVPAGDAGPGFSPEASDEVPPRHSVIAIAADAGADSDSASARHFVAADGVRSPAPAQGGPAFARRAEYPCRYLAPVRPENADADRVRRKGPEAERSGAGGPVAPDPFFDSVPMVSLSAPHAFLTEMAGVDLISAEYHDRGLLCAGGPDQNVPSDGRAAPRGIAHHIALPGRGFTPGDRGGTGGIDPESTLLFPLVDENGLARHISFGPPALGGPAAAASGAGPGHGVPVDGALYHKSQQVPETDDGIADLYSVLREANIAYPFPDLPGTLDSAAVTAIEETHVPQGRKVLYERPPLSSSSCSSSSSGLTTSTSESDVVKKPAATAAPCAKLYKQKRAKGSFETERLRNILKSQGMFTKPKVEAKRGRVKFDDMSRIFRATHRALEYKNIPFQSPPIHNVLETTMRYCGEMNVSNRLIMLSYTRTYNVRNAVEAVRAKLGSTVNLSVSCPFTMEHTLPKIHSPETVERISEACRGTAKEAWNRAEEHTHSYCPRASDYRTIIIHAATPCEYLSAVKSCLSLVQQFPKQVSVRTCTVDNGTNPLPIYDAATESYMTCQFDPQNAAPAREIRQAGPC